MIKYLNEHRFPGYLGHFFVIVSFVAALVATYAYFKMATARTPEDEKGWKKLARSTFWAQAIAVIGIVICLYYILYNHLYEYKFAYKHSNNELERKYLFSSFWEGQEGSFLLWIFWHCVLGICVMYSGKKWEAPVLAVVSFTQIFLTAFLLGLQFKNFHIGSSPFILLRNSDMGVGPIFQQPDYLKFITDGQGLNRLLQDPWMVIHPPTLFFGFAACTIPFAFAVAGLWKKDYAGWLKPALPWALVAACVLGVGILMGAKWAYQSLSFGGYWAWDPVENASLVPWLTLIGGLHAMLIYKHTGYSLRAAHVMLILTFGLVIYSTCLTRTGILGETSVHAFTGAGMQTQLWLLLLFTTAPPLAWLAAHYKAIPTIRREESMNSREFWMFIGTLVFFLSAAFVIIATSLPVYNKLFGKKIALGEKAQTIYNQVHVPIVIIIGILVAVTQYLKYKSTPAGSFAKKLLLPLLLAVILQALFLLSGGIHYNKLGPVYNLLLNIALFTSLFMVTGNAVYIFSTLKKKMMNWGGSLAHLGFGMLVAGIIISASNQKIVSRNNPMVNVFGPDSKEDPRENLTLTRGLPLKMDKYEVEYLRSEVNPVKTDLRYYHIRFSEAGGKSFMLKPRAYLNMKGEMGEGIMPSPDFRSYWNKDLFLYITSLTDPASLEKPAEFVENPMRVGDTARLRNGIFILRARSVDSTGLRNGQLNGKQFGFSLSMDIRLDNGRNYVANPSFTVTETGVINPVDSIPAEKLYFRINGVADQGYAKIAVKHDIPPTDYVAVKVQEFPMINLMWLGMIVMSIGFMLAMWNRIVRLNREKTTG